MSTSFFPIHPLASAFEPLFRFPDYSSQTLTRRRAFNPRFDVREANAAYELKGELPGLNQDDVEIEFVDSNTLVIRGRTEKEIKRSSDDGQTSVEKSVEASPEIVKGDNASEKSYQATVEDDYVDAGAAETSEHDAEQLKTAETKSTEATEAAATPAKAEEPGYRYWVHERSVGSFERRFNFAGRVDQDAVKASLKDGILSVVVPKVARQEKKITIE